ncbi:ABC transporter ATP-binding protein [Blastococcus sp. SYSU D00813]
MTAAAAVQDVTMRFRSHTALQGVSTAFEQDAITGLLGRNGAGKTTLLQLLAGHRTPTSGRVEVFGRSPFEDDTALSGICFVKEGQRYPDAFRVCDAISAASWLFPSWDADLAEHLLADFELPRKRPVKKLSRGMNSAVGIVIGLASRAPLTLFDEPYLGLDAVARQLFYDRLLADYAEHPRTVVLSTHLIEEIGDLLERVVLIDRGRVVLDDSAETLRSAALTVSGPRTAVEAFGRDREVLQMEVLGGSARAVVRVAGPADEAAALDGGLTAEHTPLQRLVVELARHTATASPAPGLDATALEEVPR